MCWCNDAVSWVRGCCRKRVHTSRQRCIQLFVGILLASTISVLYVSSASSLFGTSSTTLTEHSVVLVSFLSGRQVNTSDHVRRPTPRVHPVTPPLSPPEQDPSSSSSTSTTTTSTTSTTTSPIKNRTADVDKYVSFHGGFADGRGLGNQMFDLAAVVYVAELTGRQPAMLIFDYKVGVDEVFDHGIKRFADLCPCYTFGEDGSLRYDRRLEDLASGGRYAEEARGKSIFVSGFFQSWKYTMSVERRLRQHFTFVPELRQFVDKFMAESRPSGWHAGYVRVGIHVRRGDVLNPDKMEFGYTTPDENYFAHAMRYFVDRFERIQFIVACQDMDWCRQNFADFGKTLPQRVNVTYLERLSYAQDFAIIASCEHSIMSTGTYGWWAAWLARGITIYYADWPKNGSELARKFRREDFFPPNWIGMT